MTAEQVAAPDVAAARRAFEQLTGSSPDPDPARWPVLSVFDEIEVIRASGYFDAEFYAARQGPALDEDLDLLLIVDQPESDYGEERDPSRTSVRRSPLEHFCRRGWRELRRPRADFDLWWYRWVNLGPGSEHVDPFLHYVVAGHLQAVATRPSLPHPGAAPATTLPSSPRRACLFAGHDRDGVLDPTAVDQVRELSRHADVYYLDDSSMGAVQREQLGPYVSAAWSTRHDGGHLTSHARLAARLVGWERLADYDEVLLAGDNAFLVDDLEPLLAEMATRPSDWWSIATSGAGTAEDGHDDAGLRVLDETDLEAFSWSGPLVGLRRAVLEDVEVRRFFEVCATEQRSLADPWRGINLTRLLSARGHCLATFLGEHVGDDPFLGPDPFALVAKGVPFVSRRLLAENPALLPDLADWKERLRAVSPGADLRRIELDLVRSSADDVMRRAHSVTADEAGSPVVPEMLEPDDLVEEDRWAPKFDHWWAFPVCAFTHQLTGNERAVFEAVADDPSVKKIVLTRSRAVELEGQNVVTVPLESPEGQHYLLRAGQLFVKHGARINVGFRLLPERRNIVNLWHGIPLKRFGLASHGIDDVRDQLLLENSRSRAVIASSRVDSLAMAAAFAPLSIRDMWVTGLPRFDFVLRAESRLPGDLRRQLAELRDLVGDRKLVLFCPTFRDDQEEGYYTFSEGELEWLSQWQRRHGAVLGVREHMADTAHAYTRQLEDLGVLDLSAGRFPDVEVVYRVASAVVSDYSSCLVDFLVTGRPVVSFAYDHDRYRDDERGLFYELEDVLPGPVCADFEQLSRAMDLLFDGTRQGPSPSYEGRRRIFFDHLDDQNAVRVVDRVKRLYAGGGRG